MHYSDILRTAREEADISRREVARKAELSESHLRFIENGKRPAKLNTLRRLAMVIGIDDKEVCESWLLDNMPSVSYTDIKDKLPKGISIDELAVIHEIEKAEQMFQEAEKITAGNFNSMSPQQFFKIRDGFQNCLRFIKELELNTGKTV
jgi:transcriptional regulator with XRE-family HTH domain